jgi:hypothetical protein
MTYDQDPYEGAQFGGPGGPRRQGGGQRRSKSDGPGEEYAQVNERIQEFYANYSTGAVVTEQVEYLRDPDNNLERVVVHAAAYRTPDDPHPGRGTSWMAVPGKTPYTNGSELENAETSAWGRAIAAVGILVNKGIASASEIRAKRGEDIEPPSTVPTGPAKALAEAAAKAAGEPEPVSVPGDQAPAPDAPAPVEDAPAPEPPESAPEPAAEPEAATGPAETPEGKGDPMEGVPEAAAAIFEDLVAEPDPEPVADDAPGVSFSEFIRLTRESFVPNPMIGSVARELVERKVISQTGGVKELSDQERLLLLDELLKRAGGSK